MEYDITEFINLCDIFQMNKYERNPQRQKLMVTLTTSKPFEVIHADNFQLRGQKYLTMIDQFSGYTQAYSLSGLSGIEVVRAFIPLITRHGLPS